jgi:hypothetical protein
MNGSWMKIRLVLPLLALGAVPAATAQSPGTFAPTGDMKTPRWVHTATLLADGKVLIAGGGGVPNGFLESVELYDPQTGAFTLAAPMHTPRYGHTATLLPDGKVLITGGFAGGGVTSLPLSSAELYDPAHEIFLETGYMVTGRAFHTATLLRNGKVLIAGGVTTDALGHAPWPQFSLELYDPSTGGFTPTGTTTDCSSPETATLLANGKVFLAANHYLFALQIDMAELYDPSAGACSPIAKPPANAKLPTAIALMDGNVLITADNLDGGPTAGFGFGELYNPISGTFITTKNMTMAREEKSATLLPDGTVLITGGCLCDGPVGIGPFGSAEFYDPGKAVFSSTAEMHTARHAHTATLLNDGRVLIAGGSGPIVHPGSSDSVLLSSAEIYTPAALIPAPVLLSLSGDGKGPGAIQHSGTYQVVSPENPAVAGEALIVYCTGLSDGSVIPPLVAIGGRMAEVLWFGNTPGFVGLNQINVRMPSGVAPGTAVSVRLSYIGRPSNQVTIAVR